MTEYFFDGYSNVDDWIPMVGLENTNIILWHTFHQKKWTYEDLKRTPKWDTADKIFLVGQEAEIDHMVELDPRIYVWDALVKPDVERFYSYFWWFWLCREVETYQQLGKYLTNPLENKPKYIFDCVMGVPRPHRNYIYDFMTDNTDIKDKTLLKYHEPWIPGFEVDGVEVDTFENAKHYFFKNNVGADSSPNQETPVNFSGIMFPFHNQRTANVSTFIPYKLYNQSWFSVVTETRINHNFFTEKTAKALLSKKLFIMFSAQHALRDLKILGYKTFDNVIDESYDNEPNNEKRWKMACEQIRYLCNQNPSEIYEKVLPALEHNSNLIRTHDWNQSIVSEMRSIAGISPR